MTKLALPLAAIFVCAAALGLAACGGSSGPQTYLASDSSEVVLVQWQPDSNGIQGTLADDSISGTAPSESVSVQSAPFTGTINGSSVTLNINGGFLVGTKALYATLNDGTLAINTLSSGGSIQSGNLQSSSTSAYNQAVAALHKSISQANAQAVAAQQAQAQAQQQANTQAEQTAGNDLDTLESADSFTSDLGDLSGDVSQTNSDLAGEKTDAAAGVNGPGGPACYNLEENVDYDATENVEYDATENLGYAAISAAYQAIRQAIATANGDIDQENADVSDAYSLANGMATSSCTGPGSRPAPIRHI